MTEEILETLKRIEAKIDAMGSNPPADRIQGGFGTALPKNLTEPASDAPRNLIVEGDDAA